MSILQASDENITTAEPKPGTESTPAPEDGTPKKKRLKVPKESEKVKEFSDIVDLVAEFCGGARLKMVARRSVRISEGRLRPERDPIITEQLPDDADIYVAPPVEVKTDEELEAEAEAKADDDDDIENYTDVWDDLIAFEAEYKKYKKLEEEFKKTGKIKEEEEEPDEEEYDDEYEDDLFVSLGGRCNDPLGIEDESFKKLLASDSRDWITEYFRKCRKIARKPGENDDTYLIRVAGKLSRSLEIKVLTGSFKQNGEKTIDPDALPALLLASSAALLGAEEPTVNISFSNKFGEPRLTLLLSAENGKVDTIFFNGIHRYADKANVYFVIVPYFRGVFVEMCIKRVDLSSFGLKSSVPFGLPWKM